MSLRLGLFAFVSSGTLVAPLLQSESRLPIEPCVFFCARGGLGGRLQKNHTATCVTQ